MANKQSTTAAIGDVIEISTPNGLAYAQYINRLPVEGALLRVFSRLHDRRPSECESIANDDVQFVVFFPLQAAIRQGIVTKVGNVPLASEAARFPLFRAGAVDRTGKVPIWWLWDGEKEWQIGQLSEEQRRLPIREILNDTALIERIGSGWRCEHDTR